MFHQHSHALHISTPEVQTLLHALYLQHKQSMMMSHFRSHYCLTLSPGPVFIIHLLQIQFIRSSHAAYYKMMNFSSVTEGDDDF